MRVIEGHEHGEESGGKHGKPCGRKKRFAIVVVALFALLSLLIVVWMRRDFDVDAVLSRAGFARLPESARDVRVDSQGTLFGRRVTLVRFKADPADMRHFLESSLTASPELRGATDIRLNAVVYPSWWSPGTGSNGQRTCFVQSGRFRGIATVDSDTHTIWIQLIYESPLLRRIRRYMPFI